MANRLELLQERVKKTPPHIDSSFDYLNLSSYLTKEQNELRLRYRQFVEAEVIPKIHPYVENAEFPEYLIPKLKALNPYEHFFKPPYGKPLSIGAQGSLIAQFARGDPGVATMILVQYGLLGYTIETLGSEEQKAKYLPKIKSFQMVGGWGLTEDKIGSDASNLRTRAEKINGSQYKINGVKRWIGNGNRDLLVVWARNSETSNVEGFIVENKNVTGLTSEAIKYKLPLRIVQNCHITFNNTVVDESARLPKATNFSTGTNVILKHSRVFVAWLAVGICWGVYDHAIKYASDRKQFGQPISGFQLIQEKLVKIMANTQAVTLMVFRLSKLVEENNVSIGQIAMTKAYISERLREIAKWGREILGGNGIQHDNYLMKAVADAEAIYTYEGTYDINTLVAGREITGISAFKR